MNALQALNSPKISEGYSCKYFMHNGVGVKKYSNQIDCFNCYTIQKYLSELGFAPEVYEIHLDQTCYTTKHIPYSFKDYYSNEKFEEVVNELKEQAKVTGLFDFDKNIRNYRIDENGEVWLIDFDRVWPVFFNSVDFYRNPVIGKIRTVLEDMDLPAIGGMGFTDFSTFTVAYLENPAIKDLIVNTVS